MDLRRLRVGESLAAVSGVALLASLFLPWYAPGSVTGWESLSVIDVLLAFVAVSGVLLAIVTVAQGVPAVPIALSALVVLAGLVGVVLVLFRAIDIPTGASGREWALWLGLAGAVGVPVGAAVAIRSERIVGAKPVEIEATPAPRP